VAESEEVFSEAFERPKDWILFMRLTLEVTLSGKLITVPASVSERDPRWISRPANYNA